MVVNQNEVKITQPGRIAYLRALFVPRHKSQVFVAQTDITPRAVEIGPWDFVLRVPHGP